MQLLQLLSDPQHHLSHEFNNNTIGHRKSVRLCFTATFTIYTAVTYLSTYLDQFPYLSRRWPHLH